MLSTPSDDEGLGSLLGATIPSEVVPGVTYRVAAVVGEGAMSVAFYALRVAPEGEVPVVIKILRPWFVRQSGPTAKLIVQKEAIALGRLNERIPATPFVVRFIDTGSFTVEFGGAPLELPWVVVEYVHGGAEGTTLSERVTHSQRATGYAFDARRGAHLVDCLANGLVAVHEVGVIHRDVKPDNVLCCGFGDAEIFKIADFGVARPVGVLATFGGIIVGTVGFAAPELATNDPKAIGPWSDVFSLACVIYYVLTGEEYFNVSSPGEAIIAAVSPKRRSIRDAAGLSPELRAREQACRSIDYALAVGTAGKIEARPQRADALSAMLTPWLREDVRRAALVDAPVSRAPGKLAAKRLDHLRDGDETTQLVRWSWSTPRHQGSGRLIRSVAWDGDGRCMAATSEGLAFWNGSSWLDASLRGYPHPQGVRFIRRVAAGQWILGGDGATLAMFTPDGISELREQKGQSVSFEHFSGELDDLAVLVGSERQTPPTLFALIGPRWLKPLPLPELRAINAIARIDDAKWLVSGRDVDGHGYAAIYSPLEWDVTRIPTPSVRAYLACAGQWEPGVGIATGTDGSVVWCDGAHVSHERVEGGFELSAAGVDAVGRGWTAAAGRIWLRRALIRPGDEPPLGRWDCIWADAAWTAPFVSIFNDLGVVIAMSADGGIVEGRADRVLSSPPRPL